jgi:putative NIF3 family GTP cyclohydrolase 1 type 2
MMPLSRRDFAGLAAGSLLAPVSAISATTAITARQVVERIQRNIGVPWNPNSSRDTFKAGNPDTPVKGIATSFMSTLDVLQRSHAAGRNFIITHEPTFWHDPEPTPNLTGDPIYQHKLDFIEKNKLVVWRLHDHLHARKPDMIFAGWTRALGWDRYQEAENSRFYVLPPTTVEAVARHLAARLKTRSIRVVGDPQLKVTRVGRGSHSLEDNIAVLSGCELLAVFEARERETAEFVRDTVLSGQRKALILTSHEAGEEAGMDVFAKWLRPIVPEVPIEFIAAGDGFWIPPSR